MDPAMKSRVEQDRLAIHELRDEQDQLVVDELRKVGLEVQSVYDLVNSKASYPQAVPVLLRALDQVTEPFIKEGVVRALTDPAARGIAAGPLVREYERITAEDSDPEGWLRWAIGSALALVADDSVSDQIINMAKDRSQGMARQFVVVALTNLSSPDVVNVLLSLLSDREVLGHVLLALRKLKPPEAIPHIEPFLDHPEAWIRKEAEKALKAIHRTNQRRASK